MALGELQLALAASFFLFFLSSILYATWFSFESRFIMHYVCDLAP